VVQINFRNSVGDNSNCNHASVKACQNDCKGVDGVDLLSHHAVEDTSCAANAVEIPNRVTLLKLHHGHCFLEQFIAGAKPFFDFNKE
jgi:hypothetical protein